MKIQCIKIDVIKREIFPVEIDSRNNLDLIYKLLDVSCIDAVYPSILREGDCIYVDDEGLLKEPEHFFYVRGMQQPLAGNGLVVGTSPAGYSRSARTSLPHIISSVRFLHVSEIPVERRTPSFTFVEL